MHKDMGSLGFADMAVSSKGIGRDWLDEIDQLVDWSVVSHALSDIYDSPTGRPSYPPLILLKALLIGAWFNLSDPGLEAALDDSLSFRRFCGLSLETDVPDHSTLCRFRQKLEADRRSGTLFEMITAQLGEQGLTVRKGTLIDASLVKAQARKPSAKAGLGKTGIVDKDANWTRKGGKSHYGYKVHIAADEASLLIRRAILTPAKTADGLVMEDLVIGDEQAVYADRAYEHKGRRARLKARGIKDRIMHRSHKHQTNLPCWQAHRNKLISPIRSQVEKLFGTLKRTYGYTEVRFMSLARNQVDMHMRCLAMNLRRARKLAL